MEKSILSSIGLEITGIITPVSLCMLTVVLLVYSVYNVDSTSSSITGIRTAANLVYIEDPSDSPTKKLEGALLNAVVFIVLISIVTFLLVLLYYYNFTNFLKHYMRFSVFFVLSAMGCNVLVSVIQHFNLPIDSVTFFILLFNFTVVGVLSVFGGGGIPILVTQSYMVVLGVIVAAWFTKLPEWTTWVLLVALALYDLVAVLAPGGPLKILVELASSRDEELPALVYEARPIEGRVREGSSRRASRSSDLLVEGVPESGTVELQPLSESRTEVGRGTDFEREEGEMSPLVGNSRERGDPVVGYRQSVGGRNSEDRIEGKISPLVARSRERGLGSGQSSGHFTIGGTPTREGSGGLRSVDSVIVIDEERSPLVVAGGERTRDTDTDGPAESGRGIRLGLGDFVFYSVLVGRAAMYDLMTVYACYLGIISGLGCTLILLSVCRRALPALPISIALGVMFYFLTRLFMEPFVVGTSINLMMF